MCQKTSFDANSHSLQPKQRAMCTDSSKQSYLETDKNSAAFLTQLSTVGLELRDIEGDGNCLFRALGEQLEGSVEHHIEYRERVCDYMTRHRADFEPFLALGDSKGTLDCAGTLDSRDKGYGEYIAGLRRPGSYAGNDAIVAFGRLFEVDIVIHQLGRSPLTILCDSTKTDITMASVSRSDVDNARVEQGAAGSAVRELHISYHNNEHYASVRLKGDTSHSPTHFHRSSLYNHSSTVTADNTNASSSSSSCYSNSSNNNITKRLHRDSCDGSLSSTISSLHNHYNNNKRPRLE